MCDCHTVVLVINNLDKPHLKHLQYIVLPIACAKVFAHAESGQDVIVVADNRWRLHTFEYFYDSGNTCFLPGALGGAKCHLDVSCSVKLFGWVFAYVAITAVMVKILAEIVEQNPASAHV